MKKVVLTLTLATVISSSVFAEGVIGSQVSIGFGIPTYTDLEYDTSIAFDISADAFVSDTIYIHGSWGGSGLGQTYLGDIYTVATGTFGGGLGAEFPIGEATESTAAAIFVEGGYHAMATVLSVNDGFNTYESEPFEASALILSAGARSQQNKLLTEVALNRTTTFVEGADSESELTMSALLGFAVTNKLIIGLDSGFNFGFDYSYLGLRAGLRF